MAQTSPLCGFLITDGAPSFKQQASSLTSVKLQDIMGLEREETIDISKNEIFKNCSSKESIKRTYEAFWNIPNAIETITVLEIREVT